MTISEMHVWFRQYAQQMGMQNVRAILPEQIDLLINTSITDTVNQLIKENVGITNDRVITDNSKIGQINALRTLYKVAVLNMNESNPSDRPFQLVSAKIGRMTNKDMDKNNFPEYLFLVDFSINYKPIVDNKGIVVAGQGGTDQGELASTEETNYFPVRIIDDAFLSDTLNDFVLKPRLRSPIIVTYGTTSKNNIFDLYIDKFTCVDDTKKLYALDNRLVPSTLRISYIAKPAIVKYAEDINGENVDCDLPDYMHVDVLKHAVDLYRIATSGSLYAAQQQEQAQQQEGMRNNYRNEGNQKQ